MSRSCVLDASVTIGLAKGGVFDLLAALYDEVNVPGEVSREVIGQGSGRAGAPELRQALGVWVTEVSVVVSPPAAPTALSLADREVIELASDRGVDHVLTGDEQLYAAARRRGFICLRASEVVVLMKQEGLLNEVKSVLDRMRQNGYGIAGPIYQAALRDAGE
jgi:predicted nucleic acid-binding protein